MRSILCAGAFALAFLVGGCADIAGGVISTAQATTTETPSQEQAYADITISVDLATRTVDLAVASGKFNKATLTELGSLNDTVHAAWVKLRDAHAAHQSLNFAALNAALAAFDAYRSTHGIPAAN